MTSEVLKIDWKDKEMRAVIKNAVAADLTEAEFTVFALYAQSTGLNPLKKEIWAIKSKPYTNKQGRQVDAKLTIMTGINGFYEIANRHPQFDGLESDVGEWRENLPVFAWAKAYRKDRKFPGAGEARWTEFYKPNPYGREGTWEKMPSLMLKKCAEAQALKKAFPQELNGLEAVEAMGEEYSVANVGKAIPPPNETPATDGEKIAQLVQNAQSMHVTPSAAPLWRYDIKKLEEKARAWSENHLASIGAIFDTETELWVSPQRVKKLENYQVSEGAGEGAANE